MAEQHILDGERNIVPQKELIAEMASLGLDVSAYRSSLARGRTSAASLVEPNGAC
jgi:hypothetical protein